MTSLPLRLPLCDVLVSRVTAVLRTGRDLDGNKWSSYRTVLVVRWNGMCCCRVTLARGRDGIAPKIPGPHLWSAAGRGDGPEIAKIPGVKLPISVALSRTVNG
eukprot:5621817-Prymnesium_polylepis.1